MHCFFFASRHFFKRQSASIASHINLRRDHISNQLYCELHTSLVLVMFKIVYFNFLLSLYAANQQWGLAMRLSAKYM